jgi:hypothetical protein
MQMQLSSTTLTPVTIHSDDHQDFGIRNTFKQSHKLFATAIVLVLVSYAVNAQRVGIGTNTPAALLHVADNAVLFSAGQVITNNPPPTPIEGIGTRMMWYPAKAALRAGFVNGDHWNKQNIGYYSIALGQNVKASGDRSVALGYESIASGYASFAMGSNANALNDNAIALGYDAAANNSHSVAIGNAATAGAPNAMALGTVATATGIQSVAIGSGTRSESILQLTLGSYNVLSYGDHSVWKNTDPILVVGNGKNSSERSTALTILKNGNTGIGVLEPSAKLQVGGQLMVGNGMPQATLHVEGNQVIRRNSYTGAAHLILEETVAGDGSRLQFRNTNSSVGNWELYGKADGSNSNTAFFNAYYSPVGDAMILRGNGNVWFRGSVSQNSDARLKKDITQLKNPTEKLLTLSGYQYHWKDARLDSNWQTGLLAQEVEKVMPELVTTSSEGTKSVNYTGLVPYLLEGLKQLKQEVDALRKQLQ